MSNIDRPMYILSPGKSDFLNLVRWAAALVVVLGHVDMCLGQFSGNPKQLISFGYLGAHSHAAVVIFFVLSGYVVAFTTAKKTTSGNYRFRTYFLDRWSRIYSVLLLAIMFTLIVDFIGRSFIPIYSDPSFIPQSDFALRLFANIFALQGIQGYRIQLGSNPALWSIGYEFIFYMLYGLLFFKNQLFRRSWVAFIVFTIALVVIGWKMAIYFGIWCMGVLAYRVTCMSSITDLKVKPWLLLLILIAANHLINFNNFLGLPEILQDILFAGITAMILVVNLPHPSHWQIQVNAYLAEFSYSLYAFHMPIIFFLCSLFFDKFFKNILGFYPGILLLFACFMASRIFFILGESRRDVFRRIGDRSLRGLGL
jgi:peptidoglycan/LPS O-acetylase OafA/YrhL